jgi:polynucleotide 5'-hydroxyl-kinase GRC3/NOL9
MVMLSIGEGETITVSGPARLEVKKGKILLVGAEYDEGDSVVIHKYRSYDVLGVSNAEIEVFLGDDGDIRKNEEGSKLIKCWTEIAEHVWEFSREGKGKPVVLVLGPVESGKTTLTAFISNHFIQRGFAVGLVEGDIGQEDLAIPGTVAMVRVKKVFTWQRSLGFNKLRFVGCITPSQCREEILGAVYDLVNIAKEDPSLNMVIINTDGWVKSSLALRHKLEILRWIKPTHVVVTDRDLYETIISSVGNQAEILLADRPKNIRARDREARKLLRREAYRRYFGDSVVRQVDLSKTGFLKSKIFGGRRVSVQELIEKVPELNLIKDRIAYASIFGDVINVLTEKHYEGPFITNYRFKVNFTSKEHFKGCLVGILDGDLEEVSVGIIKDVSIMEDNVRIKILTPYQGPIGGLVAGYIRLDKDYQETGGRSGCDI